MFSDEIWIYLTIIQTNISNVKTFILKINKYVYNNEKTKLLMKIVIIKSIDNQVIIYLLYITLKKKDSLVQH